MASEAYSLTSENGNPPRNSTILITGGASGIGLATALFLHTKIYNNNIIVLDRAPSPPTNVPELTSSSRFLYCQCDVLSWPSQRAAFSAGADEFGRIDCVFVNAGVADTGDQIWNDTFDTDGQLSEPDRKTIDVDIRAVGDTLKLSMYHLRKFGGSGKGQVGSIVMTASLAGYLASAGAPLYSAAKHGVVGHLRALKGDCKAQGIAISVIAPGITLTNIVLGRKEGQSLESWGKEMGGLGVPINTAETIALCVGNLFGQGGEANGKGILIQGERCLDLEAGIAKSRGTWMGREMLELFRGGRNAPLFPNKL